MAVARPYPYIDGVTAKAKCAAVNKGPTGVRSRPSIGRPSPSAADGPGLVRTPHDMTGTRPKDTAQPTTDQPATPPAISHPAAWPTTHHPADADDPRYPIRILADGTWIHEGRPIRREALVRLFAGVLSRDDRGRYWLITPAERGLIEVEDAPLIGVEARLDIQPAGPLWRVRTNTDRWVPIDADHPLIVRPGPGGAAEPRPYVIGAKGVEIRLNRAVFYELAEAAEEGSDGFRLTSGGRSFALAPDGAPGRAAEAGR